MDDDHDEKDEVAGKQLENMIEKLEDCVKDLKSFKSKHNFK